MQSPPMVTAAQHRRRRRATTAARLEPAQLLALQLRARGYGIARIAALVGQTPEGVVALLALAAARLGASDAGAAIGEAKRRGLIV